MKKSTSLLLGFIAILGVLVYALRDKLGLGNKSSSTDSNASNTLGVIGNSHADETAFQQMMQAFKNGYSSSQEANNTLAWMMPYFENNMAAGISDSAFMLSGQRSKAGTFLFTVSQLAFNPTGKYVVNGSNSVVPAKVFTDMWNIFNALKVASY